MAIRLVREERLTNSSKACVGSDAGRRRRDSRISQVWIAAMVDCTTSWGSAFVPPPPHQNAARHVAICRAVIHAGILSDVPPTGQNRTRPCPTLVDRPSSWTVVVAIGRPTRGPFCSMPSTEVLQIALLRYLALFFKRPSRLSVFFDDPARRVRDASNVGCGGSRCCPARGRGGKRTGF